MKLERKNSQQNMKIVKINETQLENQPKNGEGAPSYNNKRRAVSFKGNYPPGEHCGKNGHALYKYCKRMDAKFSKCNQLRHNSIICKNKWQ